MKPEYAKAATTLKGLSKPISIAKVDCTVEKDICEKQGVRGFPTLKVFRDGVASDYKGQRTADSIVSTMKKQTLPAVSSLDEKTLPTFLSDNRVVIVGFLDKKSQTVFNAVADELRDDFLFGLVKDEAVATEQKATIPSIVVFKQFDEGKSVYKGDLSKKDDIVSFIKSASIPLVDDISPENYESYVKLGLPLAYFFQDTPEIKSKYGDIYNAVAKKFKGKISFVWVDATKFGSVATNLALKEEWPAFAIQKEQAKFPFDQSKEITEKALTSFVQSIVDGTLEPTLKSDPIPESQDGPVTVVVGKQFDEIVFDKKKDVLLEVYAPWCGHCKKLAPIYDELAEKLQESSKNIVIAKMDGTTNDIPPSAGIEVQGFPHIVLVKAKTNEKVPYSGDRTLEGFLAFLNANAVHGDEVAISAGGDSEDTEEEEARDEL